MICRYADDKPKVVLCVVGFGIYMYSGYMVLEHLEDALTDHGMEVFGWTYFVGSVIYAGLMALKFLNLCTGTGDPGSLIHVAIVGALIIPGIAAVFFSLGAVILIGICLYFFFVK